MWGIAWVSLVYNSQVGGGCDVRNRLDQFSITVKLVEDAMSGIDWISLV